MVKDSCNSYLVVYFLLLSAANPDGTSVGARSQQDKNSPFPSVVL